MLSLPDNSEPIGLNREHTARDYTGITPTRSSSDPHRTSWRDVDFPLAQRTDEPWDLQLPNNRNRLNNAEFRMRLCLMGIRLDESKTLIWRNIDLDNGTIFLEHAGKTRSTRRVLMRRGAIMALKRMLDRRLEYLGKSGEALDPNEAVIALPNGTVINSLKKGLGQLLAACGFLYETVAERHSMTSLRHTYATFRLTTRSGKRASVRALSKQMGTSERMIERHYGHDQIEDYPHCGK